MKKRDIILIIVLLVLSGGLLIGYKLFTPEVEEDTAEVVVSVGQKEYGRYPLNKNQTVIIPAPLGDSELEIKDGSARMLKAGCPDQVCVHQGAVHRHNDMIICIPNQIIVEIVGGEESNTDSNAQ